MSKDTRTLAGAVLRFVQAVEPMKTHTRTAWGATGRQESVAEHSWRLALLAMVVAPHLNGIDPQRLVNLCLVHDLGETLDGDVSAPLQTAGSDKGEAERKTVAELSRILAGGDQGTVRMLWEEYNEAATPEAMAAKALDKIETIIQHNQGKNPQDFDYGFNLAYGAGLGDDQPLIREIRALADSITRERASGQSG